MSTEQNKALVRRLVEEMLNRGNMNVVDEIYSPDYIEHEVPPPGVPSGHEGIKAAFSMLHEAFPDFKATIENLLAEDDRVVFHLIWTGTQKGGFLGIPPTGKRLAVDVIDIVRIANGKIVEHWGVADVAKMMQQLGAMDASGASGS